MTKEIVNQNYVRWSKTFQRVGVGLYIAVVILECAMFFVLKSQGLIYQSTGRYLRQYLLKPVLISTLIMVCGALAIRKTENPDIKKNIQPIMITLMFGNVAIIHSVFLVVLTVFCIPIFLTVVYQDKKLLRLITALSEAFVLYISISCAISKTAAGRNEYFLPSMILVMVLLFACSLVAGMSINVLNSQTTALMKATRQAQDAKALADASSQSKSVFLSSMSHEIRTPINAVLGLDEMIIRESSEPVIKDYALDVRSSGKALLALVNDVLDFSKIESGKLELLLVKYDVSSMINDLVNMIGTRAKDKNLSFKVEVSHEIPHLLVGDEVRIKQIAINLLTNAVKYTDRGEIKLCVDYEKVDDKQIKLKMKVRDTGRGIKKEDLEKLFVPFERFEKERNRGIEGTGLGMSITERLLALMDSRLEVESVYGLGSDFSFSILQQVEDWEPIGDYEEKYRQVKAREMQYREKFIAPKAKVLVVDDTPVNLKVFQGLLKQTRIQIDVAHSGMECVQLASDKKYDVIFVDHMMPDMDGLQTLERLKRDRLSPNVNTPIIALSANAISGSREYYMQQGFSEYLMKPIDPSRLEAMLIQFLPSHLVELSNQTSDENSTDSTNQTNETNDTDNTEIN